MFKNNLDRFFSKLEWQWSLANLVWGLGALASVGLPAWAVKTMSWFSAFAPLSWVSAGLMGFLLFCFGFYVYSVARGRVVRARYDVRALEKGGNANPMEKVFERKRIFINEFALPSGTFITDKTFVNCEIIGPANIYLVAGNSVNDTILPNCDAVAIEHSVQPFNSYGFISCTFRNCSFQRITFLISEKEYANFNHLPWLQWIAGAPKPTPEEPALIEQGIPNAELEAGSEGQD
jgi:hypothetical protein